MPNVIACVTRVITGDVSKVWLVEIKNRERKKTRHTQAGAAPELVRPELFNGARMLEQLIFLIHRQKVVKRAHKVALRIIS